METADNQLLYALYSVTPVLHSGDSGGEPGEDNYCTVRFVPCEPLCCTLVVKVKEDLVETADTHLMYFILCTL